MTEYMLIGAAVVALLGGGYGYIQTQRVETLRMEIASTRGELLSCGARLTNLLEDIRSDREIDNLPDSALRVVPPEWLLVVPTPAPR